MSYQKVGKGMAQTRNTSINLWTVWSKGEQLTVYTSNITSNYEQKQTTDY